MLMEGDLVLCTVERIEKTTVFVRIESGEQGTIITSEVAPGRIRNLRDYVSPGRKIVCKVLRMESAGNIQMSLRRVTPKEKKEVMERNERERNSLNILKSVLNEKVQEIADKIKKTSSLSEFLNNCKTNPSKLKEYMSEEQSEKVCKILQDKKEKLKEVKKEFKLSTKKPDGIKVIKETLSFCKGNCEISYISAGNYALKIKAKDYKEANQEINKSIESIEKQAKDKKLDFSIDK